MLVKSTTNYVRLVRGRLPRINQSEEDDAAEREVRVVDNQKKIKDSIEKENAENIRNKAMERLGQTQKEKQMKQKVQE